MGDRMKAGADFEGARVCTVPARPGASPTPDWLRSAILGPGGEVYAPAAVAGPGVEAELAGRALREGVPVAMFEGHPFVPTGWLAAEFPDRAAAVLKIEHVTRRHFAAESN